jgi:phosphoribosylaminoimidazole-succinocarboxamide synthase
MKKSTLIYEGKAKKLYEVEGHPELVYQEFKNSLTAFNGVKKSELDEKGALNRDISSLILKYLQKKGINNHHVQDVDKDGMITRKVKIIPLEVVVRNVIAGSLAKKFNMAEGAVLEKPIVDLHHKDDATGDPFISDDQAVWVLKAATQQEILRLKELALTINGYLKVFFEKAGLKLIDFKLEFGKLPNGEIILADEISPDTCRLWDLKTGEKRDKDRFRRDLGDVIENYKIVLDAIRAGGIS